MNPRANGWTTRLLCRLLRDSDRQALLGDLAEEYTRRCRSAGPREAARWCRHQVRVSLAASFRLRFFDLLRAAPWGVVAAAYVLVAILEFASVVILTRLWPEVAQMSSSRRLVLVSPGVAVIAYVAARWHRHAAFMLGALMLLVAAALAIAERETISPAYALAFLTVGPLAALAGGLLHRLRRTGTMAAFGLALFAVPQQASAQAVAPAADPTKTEYGEITSRTPPELRAFAFLIGTWEGRGKTRLNNGRVAEYPVTWIGRYILDGAAIADETHAPAPDGSRHVGITFRQYDTDRKTWIVEFLNVPNSFLRKQVNRTMGSVVLNGRNVTVTSASPGLVVREHYIVPDDASWVYRLDVSRDGGRTWDEAAIEMRFTKPK